VPCAVADTTASSIGVTVALPPGADPVPVRMRAGDIIFFTGTLVHASDRNLTADRWRRAPIGHVVAASVESVPARYRPLLAADGRQVRRHAHERGGPCGAWTAHGATPALEQIAGSLPETPTTRLH
jgi:phytanoyl-CoA hydroxylase